MLKILFFILPLMSSFASANEWMALELYDKALNDLEEQYNCGQKEVRQQLAETYYRLARWDQVLSLLNEGALTDREKHLKAITFYRLQNFNAALKLFAQLPKSDAVDFDYALALADLQHFNDALDLLYPLKGAFEIPARLAMVRISLERGAPKDARKHLEVLELKTLNEEFRKEKLILQGELAFCEKDFSAAVFFLERAMPAKNEDLALWKDKTLYLLAQAYLHLASQEALRDEKRNTFITQAKKILTLFPKVKNPAAHAELLMHLGDFYYKEGLRTHKNSDFSQADAYYSQAQSISFSENIAFQQILCLNQLGSEAAFEKSQSLINQLTNLSIGVLLKADLEFRQGLRSCQEIITALAAHEFPGELKSASSYLLGSLYFQESQFQIALQHFEWIFQHDRFTPYAPDAYFWAGRSLEMMHAPREKIAAYFQTLYEKFPDHPQAPEAYYNMYEEDQYLLGDKKALKHLQDLQELFPSSAYFLRGQYLLALDQLRDRRSAEGKWLNRKNLTAAITAFQKVESAFDALSKEDPLIIDQWQELKHLATLERAKANLLIAQESKGAKKHIYLNYAQDVFLELVQEVSAGKNDCIAEEAAYYLAFAQKELSFLDSAKQTLAALNNLFQNRNIIKSYYLAKSYELLAEISSIESDCTAALAYFDQALQSGGADLFTLEERLSLLIDKACALKQKGDLDRAMLQLSQIVNYPAVSAQRLKAMYLRAKIYAEQGRKALARKQLESLSLKGGPWAAQALQTLEQEYSYD